MHTSTSEVYGTARFVPITEEHPLQGQSPYSATKIGADQIALSLLTARSARRSTVMRPFNTYGPRQSARAVIPTIITQIAAGAAQIKLGALHPTRDFNFVRDTVRGFVAVAESRRAPSGEVINVGSGFEISIGDTARADRRADGREVEIADRRAAPAAGGQRSRAPVGRQRQGAAAARLGSPTTAGATGLRRGLAETIAWFSDPRNLRRYKADRYNI